MSVAALVGLPVFSVFPVFLPLFVLPVFFVILVVPVVPVVPVLSVISVVSVLFEFLLLAPHHHLPAQVFLLFHLAVARAELVFTKDAVNVGFDNLLSIQSPELLVVRVVLRDRA
jgi:hypothetical protein